MSLTPLRNLLGNSLKRAKIQEQIEAVQVFDKFEKVIMDKIGKKALSRLKPVLFKNGVLRISVLSSALASEIKLHEEEIIEKINKEFKKKVIKELQFF